MPEEVRRIVTNNALKSKRERRVTGAKIYSLANHHEIAIRRRKRGRGFGIVGVALRGHPFVV
jgi:hypothetical protein